MTRGLQNYIFMDICEYTLFLFNKSKSMTYSGYCKTLSYSISNDNLSRYQNQDIVKLLKYLDKVYKIRTGEMEDLVVSFFLDKKWPIFEVTVTLTNELHSNQLSKLK